MYEFEQDTQLVDMGNGKYTLQLLRRWFFGDAPNGGFMLAVGAKAATQYLTHKTPISINAQYLSPAREGSLQIRVHRTRQGKQFSQTRIELSQNDQICVQIIAVFGELNNTEQPDVQQTASPSITTISDCIEMHSRDNQFRGRIKTRIEPSHYRSMQTGDRNAPMQILGWAQMSDNRPCDALALLIFADAFPRAIAPRSGLIGWIPTLDLSVQYLRAPVQGAIACSFESRSLAYGLVEEVGSLWDSDANLVAVCRQTAAPRIPDAHLQHFDP